MYNKYESSCIGCGSNCGTQHMNKQFNPAASSSNADFTCREKFGNYMCSDCQTKCHFEIVIIISSCSR